jgi:type II secretion system protein N
MIKALMKNKSKIFMLILTVIVFVFLLFPFNELGDLVSSQVSKLSGNQLSVQFDRMSLNLIPIGLQLGQVRIDPANMSSLTMSELSVHPSLAGLISQKPYGSIIAEGLFNGNIKVQVGSAPKTEKGTERQSIQISAQKISLSQIRQMANLPLSLKGNISLETIALADLALAEPPEISELNLVINQFEIASSTILMPVPGSMDPNDQIEVTIPGLKLSRLELKGRLSDGKFYIESCQIGKPGDEVVGQLKGTWNIDFINSGGRITPHFGAYDLQLDIKLNKSFQEKASSYLSLVENYKNQLSDGTSQYKIRLSGANSSSFKHQPLN